MDRNATGENIETAISEGLPERLPPVMNLYADVIWGCPAHMTRGVALNMHFVAVARVSEVTTTHARPDNKSFVHTAWIHYM